MEAPVRSDYPKGAAGDKQFKAAQVKYKKFLAEKKKKEQNTDLNYAPIILPGLPSQSGISDVQAKAWFKYTASKAPKGSAVRRYYDDFVAGLARAGVPKDKYQDAWDEAVNWTQALGSGSKGDPAMFLQFMDPADFADKDNATKKYGTTKSKQTTVTQYSPSSAGADITKQFESELGRTATSAETAGYLKAVNEKAKKEAQVYTATTTTSPGKGGVDQTTTMATSTTGFDPTMFAQNYARSMPDYAESFAAKNVLKIIEGLIGSDRTAIGKVVQ
jgi:hypothetical protein